MKSAINIVKTKLRNAKLLIIEDNDDQWLIIQQAMNHCMNEVTAHRAINMEQALILIEGWHYQEWEYPRLILLDLYLPNSTSGWQLLKKIKAMPTVISKVPIVMLTASADHADIVEAYQLGASAYMVKPVEFSDWLTFFRDLRKYWWETATLPPIQYRF